MSSSSSSRDTRGRTARQDGPNPTRSRTPHLSISIDDIVTIIRRLASDDEVADDEVMQVGSLLSMRRPGRNQVLAQLGDQDVSNAIRRLDTMLTLDGENESFHSAVISLETLQEAAERARERARADTERARADSEAAERARERSRADTERARADAAESRASPRAEVALARALTRNYVRNVYPTGSRVGRSVGNIRPSQVLRWRNFNNEVRVAEKIQELAARNITILSTQCGLPLQDFELGLIEEHVSRHFSLAIETAMTIIQLSNRNLDVDNLSWYMQFGTAIGTSVDIACLFNNINNTNQCCFCPVEVKAPLRILSNNRTFGRNGTQPPFGPPDFFQSYYGIENALLEVINGNQDPPLRMSTDLLLHEPVEERSVDIQLPAGDSGLINSVAQLVGYMIATNNEFGILTTFEFTYFCKLDENAKLYVSDAFQAHTSGPMSTMSVLYAFLLEALGSYIRRGTTRIPLSIRSRTYMFIRDTWCRAGGACNQAARETLLSAIFEASRVSDGDSEVNQARDNLSRQLPLSVQDMMLPFPWDPSWTLISSSEIAITSSVKWEDGLDLFVKFRRSTIRKKYREFAEESFSTEISMYTGPLRELQGIHVPFMIFGGEFTLSRVMIATAKCGTSLDKLDSRTLSLPGLLAACVKSLEAVHKLGVLHGDIRLANFALLENQTSDSDSVKVFLIDFGSASFAPIPYKEAKERQISGGATGAVKRSQQDNMYIVSQYNTADPYAVEMAELHSLFQID